MGFTVREGAQGDMGAGGHKNSFAKDPKSIKEGKEGGKKEDHCEEINRSASGLFVAQCFDWAFLRSLACGINAEDHAGDA